MGWGRILGGIDLCNLLEMGAEGERVYSRCSAAELGLGLVI